MTRLQSLRLNAQRWGWLRAVSNVVVKGCARYLGVHVYVVRTRPLLAERNNTHINLALILRPIDPDELAVVCQDPELDMTPDFVRNAVARGDLAFGAFDGSRLIGYIWRSIQCAPDADGVWVRVKRPYNYSYKAYTRPAYRGQRISPALFLYSDDEVRKLGYEYRVGFVGLTNHASLELSKHIGATIIGRAGYLAWFGKLFSFRSAAVKKIGFEFFRPNDPG